jgi:hypothetical protein
VTLAIPSREELEDKELPTDLATSSFIRQSERSQILGLGICGKAGI